MNRKEKIEKIEESLRAGLPKGDIFRALGATDDVARSIAATPGFGDRKEYSKLNNLLFAILIYTAAAKALSTTTNLFSSEFPMYLILMMLPLSLFYPLIAVYLAVGVKNFRGGAYALSGGFCLYLFFSSIQAYAKIDGGSELLVSLILNIPLFIGGILGFYLKRKLCPQLGLWGAKTTESGSYSFLEIPE
ncbi:MAG TPA: hypothetical protein VF790_09760 [Dissulfurispiraceae bacterium]